MHAAVRHDVTADDGKVPFEKRSDALERCARRHGDAQVSADQWSIRLLIIGVSEARADGLNPRSWTVRELFLVWFRIRARARFRSGSRTLTFRTGIRGSVRSLNTFTRQTVTVKETVPSVYLRKQVLFYFLTFSRRPSSVLPLFFWSCDRSGPISERQGVTVILRKQRGEIKTKRGQSFKWRCFNNKYCCR